MLFIGVLLMLTLTGPSNAITDEEAKLFVNTGCADGKVSVIITANGVTVTTNGRPDHIWQKCNPNQVVSSEETYTFPLKTTNPDDNDPVWCMGGGPIGVAINGVYIYSPMTHLSKNAVDGKHQEQFDSCEGHPDDKGTYHYHKLPKCLHKPNTEHLVGIMADGYPIYAPYENGRAITSADLDKCGGKVGSDGNYRYYLFPAGEANFPYSNGCFRAQPAQIGPPSSHCTQEMEVNHLCECGKGGQPNTIHSYESVTDEGTATVRQCTEVPHDDDCDSDGGSNGSDNDSNNGNNNGSNFIAFSFSLSATALLTTIAMTRYRHN